MGGASVRTSTKRRKVNGGFDGVEKRTQKAQRGPRRVKVGLPKGTGNYPDGTPIIKVGVIHEFGSEDGKIPERSFLRATFRKNLDEYRKLGAELKARIDRDDLTMREALELLGTRIASDVREEIVSLSSPPNTAETIRRKGSSNPLIDTGHLRQQITHQVIDD